MDDRLLVGVLHAFTDLDEDLEPLLDTQSMAFAKLVERHACDPLHDEVQAPAFGRAAVEHLGDLG